MHKRKLHHKLIEIRRLPSLILLALAIFFAVTAIFALRQNNLRMIELKAAVFAADEAGGDVEKALRELREHVYNHMNTNLVTGDNSVRPPIQLKYTYDRLVAAEQAKIQVDNPDIYQQAEVSCAQRFGGGQLAARTNCIQEYVGERGVEESEISEDLYKFDFASPVWSPDLAGWSLVLAGLFGFLFLIRIAVEYLIKFKLDH